MSNYGRSLGNGKVLGFDYKPKGFARYGIHYATSRRGQANQFGFLMCALTSVRGGAYTEPRISLFPPCIQGRLDDGHFSSLIGIPFQYGLASYRAASARRRCTVFPLDMPPMQCEEGARLLRSPPDPDKLVRGLPARAPSTPAQQHPPSPSSAHRTQEGLRPYRALSTSGDACPMPVLDILLPVSSLLGHSPPPLHPRSPDTSHGQRNRPE